MDNCPFCENIKLKSRIIDETENTLTILSNPALVKGYCLVIPKKHVENFDELSDDEKQELFFQVIKMQEILLKKFSGCDIRQNFRPFQPQGNLKVNHLHIHLQPREFKDELYDKCQIFETEVFRDLSDEELNELVELIKNAD